MTIHSNFTASLIISHYGIDSTWSVFQIKEAIAQYMGTSRYSDRVKVLTSITKQVTAA